LTVARPELIPPKAKEMHMPMTRLKIAITATLLSLTGALAHANGLCPYDDQGAFGCPEGTVWNTEYDVCIAPDPLVG
jgi:hypothetical protein